MISIKNYVIILLLFLLASCSSKKNVTSGKDQAASKDSITDLKLKEATVIDYSEVDGCRFLLELDNKEKLQPDNLPPEFEKDKLKILIRYHLTNKMTVCMAGKTAYIDYIKIKKE